MTEIKPIDSLNQKPIHDSTEPLTLRPPVGSEVGGFPRLQFRSMFSRGGSRTQPRRLLLHHCLLSALLLFVLLSVLLLIVFVLGVRPLVGDADALRSHRRRSMCMVFVPQMPFPLTEYVSGHDDVFNVTLLSRRERLDMLHICSKGLTVIRTVDQCFIRPISQDMRRACIGSYMRYVQDGNGLRKTVRANQVNDEIWFAEPPSTIPELIKNSLIMEFCAGLPALRLVSQPPPTGYVVDAVKQESESPMFGTPSNDDEKKEDDGIDDFMDTLTRDNIRVRRSAAMKSATVKQSSGNQVESISPVHCRMEASFFEGPVMRLNSESDEVKLIRDTILQCHQPSSSTH